MSEIGYKKVVIVDERDNVIGAQCLLEAKEKGLLRRAARVFVFDERGRLLIQRRSKKVFAPLLLDQSVGGHVDEGESYFEAANRELKEELGLEQDLEEVVTSFRSERFFNGIYRIVISSETDIRFDKNEIAEVFWIEIPKLEKMMTDSREQFTGGFLELWPQLRDKIIP